MEMKHGQHRKSGHEVEQDRGSNVRFEEGGKVVKITVHFHWV